jgi:hypothetical protein
MAHRTHHPIQGAKSDLVVLTAQLTGGGAATDLVNAESANQGGGEVVSGTYSATGIYTLVFRYKYPQLKFAPTFSFVGTTDGLNAQCTAFDAAAGTATIEVYVGNTKTDLATTDTMYMLWGVRNSGRNR